MAAVIQRVNAKLTQYESELHLSQYAYLNLAHDKTGLQRIHIVLAAASFMLLLSVYLFGTQFVSNVFAFIPVYASFKALRSPGKLDDEKWLTYWSVFGSFQLLESFFDAILWWAPLYFSLKIAFLVYCFHPQTQGALVVYQRFLGPLFANLQSRVHHLSGEFDAIQSKSKSGQPGAPSVPSNTSSIGGTASRKVQ